MRRILLFSIVASVAATTAGAQSVSGFEIGGFRLGANRAVYREVMRVAGDVERPYTSATLPSSTGPVNIQFLCPELGAASYLIMQTRRMTDLTTDDIKNALIQKYGKPRLSFRGVLAGGQPNPHELSLIWSDKPLQITRQQIEGWANEGGMYSGPGLSVKITGRHPIKRVELHLLAENGIADVARCAQIRAQARNREAVDKLKF